ncbi:serine/threonine-protein kinase [Pendulispora albinea]|uniref:Serine/threonine protein kinase n=1 Tax=Pendulispora albinea TaxID=2741071 RepID=A0ABZ2LS96_9BACT
MDGLAEKSPDDVFADRFLIEKEAGVGGMGIVYRALDRVSAGPVALKVLRRTEPSTIKRFATEAGALENLDHPAVVRYVAHGVSEEGEPYLAMEWIEGESLHVRLARASAEGTLLAVRDVLELGQRVAGALAAAHALGIVHRDVKPNNILLVEGDLARAKLADFGIARADFATHVTTSGVILGTVGYMAPEQARGATDLDGRADLFALGCVLFRCLTNKNVFEGPEPMAMLAKLLLHEAPRVGELRPGVPAALEDLVAKLLARERDNRPASALDVLAELARIATMPLDTAPMTLYRAAEAARASAEAARASAGGVGRAGAAKAAGGAESTTLTDERTPPASAHAAREGKASLGWRTGAVVVLGLAVLFAAVLTALFVRHRGESRAAVHAVDAPRAVHAVDAPRAPEPAAATASAVERPEEPAAAPSASSAVHRAPRARPKPSAAPEKPDCNPHYYFDAQGIRRAKPECL